MPRPSPTTPAMVIQMVRLYRNGVGRNQLAARFAVPRKTVSSRLRAAGITLRPSAEVCKANLRHDAFANAEDDPEAAYWVGMLMADGCVSTGRGRSSYVILALTAADSHHVRRFVRFLKSACTVSIIPSRQLASGHTCKATARTAVSSKQLVADLARYGVVPAKSASAQVAPSLANNPHFWRGVVDGDGSLRLDRRRSYARPVLQLVGSEALMYQFAEFAGRVAQASAKPHRHKSIWGVGITSAPAQRLAAALYVPGAPSLPRKSSIAVRFARCKFPGRGRRMPAGVPDSLPA
jgi:hypothetical protein